MNRKVLAVLLVLASSCGYAHAQKFQINTNAVLWMSMATINFQADYAVQQHWTVGLGAKYNPFEFPKDGGDSQMQYKQRSMSVFARWWPWHVYSGWWVCPRIQVQEYNMGGIISASTEEGMKYGGGVSAGYTYMVNPHLNVEFGMGFWGGLKNYVVYSCPKCGIRVKEGSGGFILPNDLMIGVSYVF